MILITDITKAAIMETPLKEYLDEQITKWLGVLNAEYAKNAECRYDTDDPIIDYAKGTLSAYIDLRTRLYK